MKKFYFVLMALLMAMSVQAQEVPALVDAKFN